MKHQQVQGIDSAVWEFRNQEMTLSLDYGRYSNDLQYYSNQPEYHAEWLRIAGRKAKLATFRLGDESIADSREKDREFVAAVYFPEVSGSGETKLTFWPNTVDVATQESAKKISFGQVQMTAASQR
jgi:hypothetical protein